MRGCKYPRTEAKPDAPLASFSNGYHNIGLCILQSFASLVCEVHAVTVVSTELGVSLVEARLQDDLGD